MPMKILVTGGCGFLGSHVCEYYLNQGAEVISYDNMTKHELARTGFNTEASRDHNWNLLEKMGVTMVKEDIRNAEALLDYSQGCNYIVHTAAQPAMTISWEDPLLDISTNVMGTFNVLETARKLKIPIASCATIHVYGNQINDTLREAERRYVRDPVGISETHATLEGTLSPLHASKMAGDIYVQAYIDTYQLKAASFRLTGIYGTRQFGGEDHGWVANFTIRALTNRAMTLFGTGKQVRDILYVTDVCRAFDAFYKQQEPGIYNIGGGEKTAISLLECIDLLAEINQVTPDVQYGPDRHGDLRYFICDISKAKKALQWEPQIMPKEGVTQLSHWIKENIELFTQ
ncbi:NAD-dependent epimerase/dehydratase family protein [Magnetococcales bacterium HHB-1]